ADRQHPLALGLDGHDGGLADHDAAVADVDQRVGGAKVDPDVAGEQAEDSVEHSEEGPLSVVARCLRRAGTSARNERGERQYSRDLPISHVARCTLRLQGVASYLAGRS